MTARPAPKKAIARPTVVKAGPSSDDPFEYTTDGGGTVTVPSLAKLFTSAGELRRMRKMSAIDLAMYVVERDCDAEQLEAFDAMPMDEFERFSEQWAEHSGVDVGESSAS